MSILIKGMEMPKDGAERSIVIRGDGKIRTFTGAPIDYATAIPVPPHGRLIDADAIDESLGIEDQDVYVHWTLESAPTIIEAEENDD